ncbi:MAG TPA: DUF4956 domain-containing protein [Oribacterium sp.]|mgnify:CR=1 FL=1|nr:DUF4956 domain-containing protein [Oribacterium sp.]
MSVKDVIKNSFLQQMGSYDLGNIAISLVAAVLLGVFIYYVYKTFYTGVIYSRSFAVTLVGMCVLTCMVTLAISTNVVISLGMVGALSIVRFRTAIKDPMDLLYLFWTITVGITTGAGMYGLALTASLVMVIMIVAFYYHQESGRIYIVVVHYAAPAMEEDIFRAFHGQRYRLKSETLRGQQTELAAEVFVRNGDTSFAERMRMVEGVQDVTLIQYNGEYHG